MADNCHGSGADVTPINAAAFRRDFDRQRASDCLGFSSFETLMTQKLETGIIWQLKMPTGSNITQIPRKPLLECSFPGALRFSFHPNKKAIGRVLTCLKPSKRQRSRGLFSESRIQKHHIGIYALPSRGGTFKLKLALDRQQLTVEMFHSDQESQPDFHA